MCMQCAVVLRSSLRFIILFLVVSISLHIHRIFKEDGTEVSAKEKTELFYEILTLICPSK